MFKKTIGFCMAVIMLFSLSCIQPAFAATTTAPAAADITVTNNCTGVADTVVVNNVDAGDVVKVYSSSSATTPIGTATATETSVTVSIDQIGKTAGSVYVSLTSSGNDESTRTSKAYTAEPTSTAPAAADITVTNYTSGDTVVVKKLEAGDVVKVYASSTATTPLGTATVASGETSATVSIDQLGEAAGKVYVSVKESGKNESTRTAVSYDSQKTAAPTATTVTVTNNYSTSSDTVVVTGLEEGVVVKVYATATATETLGTATAGSGETSKTISISQLGVAAGKVYVTLKAPNKDESTRTAITYTSEPRTTAPVATNITVTNNITGVNDTIAVSGLAAGNVVYIYATATGTTPLSTATVESGQTSVTITLEQLGKVAGKVYVSVKDASKLESLRTLKAYTAEAVTTAPTVKSITVTNNYAPVGDTVVVTGLAAGDKVNVYATSTATSPLGTATVASGETSATVNIEQIGTGTGKVYVSVKASDKNESLRTAASYTGEKTTAPTAKIVTVTNNYSTSSDTIVVSGLAEGDVVKVYATAKATETIGSKTVGSGETSATITISQLGAGAGKVYVSLTKLNKSESQRTAISYLSEPTSTAPVAKNITVTNNVTGTDDTVVVSGLTAGQQVLVYSVATGGTPIGSATVASGETSATVSIAQVGVKAGKVYVAVKDDTKVESLRTVKSFAAEAVSAAPVATKITVTNKVEGKNDTVAVTGLKEGDIVKVYATATATEAIGTATVGSGETSATVSIAQLGAKGGKVYVSVTELSKLESKRTVASFGTETTAAPVATKIMVINNSETDYIIVAGLKAGDEVKVYTAATGGTALATGTVAEGNTGLTINATIPSNVTKLYISVTSPDMIESARTAKAL